MWKTLSDLHQEVYGTVIQERQTIQRTSVEDLPYLADVIYLCKQARDLAHDMRKELDAFINVAEKITSLLWAQGDGETIHGAIATGVPQPGVALSPPTKSGKPEEYAALMRAMGVPEEWWGGECDVLRPHFPGLEDYATKTLAEGGNLPPAFAALKQTPRFTVTSRKHRDVDVDVMCKQYPMNEDE